MASSLSISSGNSFNPELTNRRLIFNGEKSKSTTRTDSQSNKKVKRRRVSPLVMILTVLSIALMAVFFIWNKITVSYLLGDINKMQLQYQNIVGKNEILRAEVHQKSRLELIEKIAQTELGLTYPKEKPVMFELENQALQ